MKPGTIIQNYQGQFAKVTHEKNGITHFTAWVKSKELAEAETVAINRLNEFGLSQVLAKGENAPGAEGMGEGEKPLSKLTVDELKAIADEMGLATDGKKADLVASIEAKRAEGMGEGE